jgi:hypothetical protein
MHNRNEMAEILGRTSGTEQHSSDRKSKKIAHTTAKSDASLSDNEVKPRSNEKSVVAKSRAKNNLSRDRATNLGKGKSMAVVLD